MAKHARCPAGVAQGEEQPNTPAGGTQHCEVTLIDRAFSIQQWLLAITRPLTEVDVAALESATPPLRYLRTLNGSGVAKELSRSRVGIFADKKCFLPLAGFNRFKPAKSVRKWQKNENDPLAHFTYFLQGRIQDFSQGRAPNDGLVLECY